MRLAVATSLVLHGLILILWLAAGGRPASTPAPAARTLSFLPLAAPAATAVLLPVGPADADGASSPSPRADLDAPDPRPAAAATDDSVTGRADHADLRAQMWNDPSAYRLPRTRTGAARATGEAIMRRPDPGLDTASASYKLRTIRRRVLAGAGQTPPRSAARPLVTEGPAAVDAARHARVTVDDATVAQASNELHPGPFDLARPPANARDDGHGQGGTPLDVPRGLGQPATRARAQDDYFRALYARVRERVAFPPKLALAFEQGEVVVTFTLRRDGTVAEVRVARPSGFVEFDQAVVSAVRAAGPFGPVPEAVAEGKPIVTVNAPFVFDNPLIR